MNVRWLPPLAAVLCSLLTVESDWSRDYASSSVTAVLPLLGQCCGTVCLNSFGSRTSPLDNSNDGWKRLCLVSWAAAPCVWTLRAMTRNLLIYLLSTPLLPSLSLSSSSRLAFPYNTFQLSLDSLIIRVIQYDGSKINFLNLSRGTPPK